MCLEKLRGKLQDHFNQLQEKIQKYVCYIIVSPVYFYEMSESAKPFFDRLKRCQSFHQESKL